MSDELGAYESETSRITGYEYSDKLRESLLFEFQLRRINHLASVDLMQTENRTTFKASLASLSAMLSNYKDEQFHTEMKEIITDEVGNSAEEISKSFRWYSILKDLISRCPFYKKSTAQYEAEEV